MSTRGFQTIQGAHLEPGTGLLYRFDSVNPSGNIVTDAAGNADLTYTDTSASVNNGIIGNALYIDGPEILYAAGSTFLTNLFLGPWTFETWIKPIAPGVADESGNLLTYLGTPPGDGASIQWLCNIVADFPPASPGFWYPYVFWNPPGLPGENYVFLDWRNLLLPINQWYHMAVRKTVRLDGLVDADLFIDGVRITTGTFTEGTYGPGENPDLARGVANAGDPIGNPSRYNLAVAAYTFNGPVIPPEYGFGPDGSFNGLMDDTRVINYARTDRQILETYRKGL